MGSFAGKNRSDLLQRFIFFTLFWVGANTNSTTTETVTTQGTTTPMTTVPPTTISPPDNVYNVTVTDRTNSTITLTWTKVNNISSYFLRYVQEGDPVEKTIMAPPDQTTVTETVSPLTPATEYNFTLITSDNGVNSSGTWVIGHTAPLDVQDFMSVGQNESSITLQWTTQEREFSYELQFEGRRIELNDEPAGKNVTHTIPGLTSATIYKFFLFTVYENISSSGVSLTAATAPGDVGGVTVVGQNETSITLKWRKFNNTSTYKLEFDNSTIEVTADDRAAGDQWVTLEVNQLNAGTSYDFRLFTVFLNLSSTGRTFNASTVPSQPAGVNVTSRSETSLTVRWWSANKNWRYVLHVDGRDVDAGALDSLQVTRLQPGTLYNFSLVSVFSGLRSSPHEGFAPTTIDCAGVAWQVTTSSIQGRVRGLFSEATAANETDALVLAGDPNVEFTDLYPGVTYHLNLVYERDSQRFDQCHHSLQTYPPDVIARCEYLSSGYSISVVLDQPVGQWSAVEMNVTERNFQLPKKNPARYNLSGFQPARTYLLSVATVSGRLKNNNPTVFKCATDPRGVIGGSVVAFLILVVIVALIGYMVSRRWNMSSKGSSKERIKNVLVSAANFPDHYCQLSADDDRGFSEQYEALFGVGAEQAQHFALHPENQVKNRFTNILPYDWSRVKISGKSDYINANFMPGYHDNQEYIASQGPLTSTVSDFWKMIWEQNVRTIVMVTNCVENGRTKCEKYWPAPNRPGHHEELRVSVVSEAEDTNWTLTDMTIEHKSNSEQRTVRHFHFTAWPDHGVPQTTDVLIQFRKLVREHMEAEVNGAPTVVHCSAGVGRTGTIIALDVLLQQLEQERAVDIHGFVHKMRLRRPHMVQTEAQYVYLHQCILDSLPSCEQQDNIYENSDMIYINATALKELH